MYKAVGIILTLAVITGCVRTISEAAPFYQPKEVFSHYKDYSYYQMNVDSDSGDGDRADRLSLKLYQEYLQKKKTFAMVELQDPGSYDANYIYADAGALPYLRGTIPELSKMDLREQTVYRISPANYEKTGNKQGDEMCIRDRLLTLSEALETPVSVLLGETIEPPKADDLKVISEKLELINLQLAQRKRRRRKMLHWLFLSLCAITVMGLSLIHISDFSL